ncbi:MAG TPA: LysM peptidoglycan-binding domain-containing protein [Herpetosiphonaceae bacterium]
MSRQHGELTYFIEGEGLIVDQKPGDEIEAISATAPEAASVMGAAEVASTVERAFRFSRMFKDLEKFRPSETALIELGLAMDEAANGKDHPSLPAGFTYFGQFLDHDITFDQTDGLPSGELTPEEILQGRSPSIDLDSVYGRGPQLEAKRIYAADKIHLRIGRTEASGEPTLPEGRVLPNDLPRGDNPARPQDATIGDPRNDENLAVAQTHLAFLKFHNAVVDRLAPTGLAGSALFEAARRTVIEHYQSIVLHDYLPQIVDPAVLQDVLTNGRRFYQITAGEEPTMPIEFSVAAYRFGHSMIRDLYGWNRIFDPASLGQLFSFSGVSGQMIALPSTWPIDWRRFYDFRGVAGVPPTVLNTTRSIDTALALPLNELPEHLSQGVKASLAVRNLLRGRLLGLPSGQALAEVMRVTPLTAAQVRQGPHATLLQRHGFDTRTPLWYYILKEAEVLHDGRHLGPVGSRLLAETLVGLIQASQISILSEGNRDWRPSLPARNPQHYSMVDLLLLVDDLNPLGELPAPPPPSTIYTVQPGDTLGLIARRFLRNDARWPEIFEINRDKLTNPNAIRVGQQLRIPIVLAAHIVQSGETLGSIARLGLGDAGRWREIFDLNRDRVKDPNVLRSGQELRVPFTIAVHVVQRGDTLRKIAAEFLGSELRWREIFESNREQLANPDQLRVGQRLQIVVPLNN